MKKELLLATTIAGITLGATAASAVTGTMSGSNKVGLKDVDLDSDNTSDGTMSEDMQSNFSVSLEETMDSGTKISTSFTLSTEGTASANESGLTLTFTDGSSLQLISAGEASDNFEAAVPNASGEIGIGADSSNAAKSGIDGVSGSNAIGFDWSSEADFMDVEGLSVGFSYSNGDESEGASAAVDSGMSAGISYVSDQGDTTVTIGAGFLEASDADAETSTDTSVYHMGVVAVNGDLTVGAGVGGGEFAYDAGTGDDATQEVEDWEATEIGFSYVSGDLTFTAHHKDSTANDVAQGTTVSSTDKEDSREQLAASVDYAVVDGVTTTIAFSSDESSDEGANTNSESGNTWYIGTKLSF
ncbi:MAG: hypothetical protein CFH21_00137 [Alphaproteobacteria bacterium MarineAlpha5_Bin11]|nr:hypothetical protein [Pelagibacteraceae bacterium]PPR44889.1 MAG: hypothetical protein CFH21_00137 [Alphaproteobacteria bacterium MarineAlpha5_Bin11]PPR51855.1 MAG: hypothetical protein CFH20_00273 [Alphaproteobacteria bacterium MarineAlpha5_Bin10]|tara:strand:- start:756 stop:1826 length:1071 start_codon:yes stop_codon:yes gene_type:complete